LKLRRRVLIRDVNEARAEAEAERKSGVRASEARYKAKARDVA